MCCSLSACTVNKGATEHYMIEYIDGVVDKEALDTYFLTNEDLYPSYKELKGNVLNLLDNTKLLKSSEHFTSELELIRFSTNGNGFLGGETFLFHKGNYRQLGIAFGGHGVTEIIRKQGNAGYWIYYIYSWGSGIHRTSIGIYELIHGKEYFLKDLKLELNKDYTFVVDSDNTIDLYEATIIPSYSADGFVTYTITKKDLVLENIDDMQKIAIAKD